MVYPKMVYPIIILHRFFDSHRLRKILPPLQLPLEIRHVPRGIAVLETTRDAEPRSRSEKSTVQWGKKATNDQLCFGCFISCYI